jgi:hypothetical protein
MTFEKTRLVGFPALQGSRIDGSARNPRSMNDPGNDSLVTIASYCAHRLGHSAFRSSAKALNAEDAEIARGRHFKEARKPLCPLCPLWFKLLP